MKIILLPLHRQKKQKLIQIKLAKMIHTYFKSKSNIQREITGASMIESPLSKFIQGINFSIR
ncbi:MAG: hypothetical protein RLZZ546_2641 [Bacteroidota bacterium]|jgi:hypothetical protein